MIDDVDLATAQALAIAMHEPFESLDGTALKLTADTICLHGDGAQAALFAQHLLNALQVARVQVAAMDPAIL